MVASISGVLIFGSSLLLLAQSGTGQSPTFSDLVHLNRTHWIEGCTDASFSRQFWGWLIETGSDSERVFDCLLRETDIGAATKGEPDRPGRLASYEGVLYRPPFFNDRAIPGRAPPTRNREALIRTPSAVLMVSGHYEFLGGDWGLTQLVHVSDDLFLVGVGYASHDRIHKFFVESATTQYLSNGRVEAVDAKPPSLGGPPQVRGCRRAVVYGKKSYFASAGGAFWIDAVVDCDGNIVDILPQDSDFVRCIDVEEFKRKITLDLSRIQREKVCYER